MEFISLLTYSVDDLKLEKPCHFFSRTEEYKNEGMEVQVGSYQT